MLNQRLETRKEVREKGELMTEIGDKTDSIRLHTFPYFASFGFAFMGEVTGGMSSRHFLILRSR